MRYLRWPGGTTPPATAVRFARTGSLILAALCSLPALLQAQAPQIVHLSLESAVDLALVHSYPVRQLHLGIAKTRSLLKAQRAGLRSRVYLDLTTPEFTVLSDHKWNSDLRQYEIIRENTRLWQMNFSIRQPVVLFGYPTNGYLSLNNRLYRYMQWTGDRNVRFYNRYFVQFEQPLFEPNTLKNDIEQAELDLESAELQFLENVAGTMSDNGYEFYDLFELTYKQLLYAELVENLDEAAQLARSLASGEPARAIEVNQVQVELANTREGLQQVRSLFRLEASRLKQRLGLRAQDSLSIESGLRITPVAIDVEEAVDYGLKLRPRLRQLEIHKRKDQLQLKETKAWDSFRASLEVTYGREMQHPHFGELWEEPSNSYSLGLHAYVPIWDWGQRKARIEAEKISLQQTELSIEESQHTLRSEISNAVQDVREYLARTVTMQHNLTLARSNAAYSLRQYERGEITMLELLQTLHRQETTAMNFLDVYLGYRKALLTLQVLTFYDFEKGRPLSDRLRSGR